MNFDPNNFAYSVHPSSGRSGLEIVLTHLASGKEKTFYMAVGRPEHVPFYEAHMDSLTDDLMIQWFESKKQSKEEKKAAKAAKKLAEEGAPVEAPQV